MARSSALPAVQREGKFAPGAARYFPPREERGYAMHVIRHGCTRRKKEYAPREYVKKHTPNDQKSLDEKAAAARKAGMSYVQYSAMRRGLLKL